MCVREREREREREGEREIHTDISKYTWRSANLMRSTILISDSVQENVKNFNYQILSRMKWLKNYVHCTTLKIIFSVMRNCFFNELSRMFINGPGDRDSIPDQLILKTQKMVLDTSLLNTQHYKVRIKSKLEQSKNGAAPFPTPWRSSYWKESLPVTFD